MHRDLFVCWHIEPTAGVKTGSLEPAASIERVQSPPFCKGEFHFPDSNPSLQKKGKGSFLAEWRRR